MSNERRYNSKPTLLSASEKIRTEVYSKLVIKTHTIWRGLSLLSDRKVIKLPLNEWHYDNSMCLRKFERPSARSMASIALTIL